MASDNRLAENRDPAFWKMIASHPSVTPYLNGLDVSVFDDILGQESVTPLASKHGGFLFITRDGWGRVRELHTLFTPEGWGREAHMAALEAIETIFVRDCDAIITYADESNYRTQPPRSFGFRPCATAFENDHGRWRTWMVTRDAWEASAAHARRAA